MKNKISTAITLGFALFAMFFGAGNLILPPFIGLKTGTEWFAAIAGFFTTGIVSPFLGVLTVVLFGTSFTDLGRKVNPAVVTVLALLIMLCIGPLVAIPRTGATTYEIGIKPLFPEFNNILFSLIFFGIVLALSITQSKIVDIIGNFLTPFLILSLGILVTVGLLNPTAATENTGVTAQESFIFAFHEGYQTLDVLASVIFAGIIISAAIDKGYTNARDRFKITIAAGLISMAALLFIYGGLIYLGAHSGYGFSEKVSRTELLLNISQNLMGKNGTLVISVAVAMACLTTAIALTSAMGSFLQELTKGKMGYKAGVILTCLVSGYFSVKSVDEGWYMDSFIKPSSEDGLKFYREMGTLKDGYEKYYKDNFFMTEIMNHPNYDEYWQKRSLLPHLKNVNHAVMTVGGWYDAEDLFGPLNIYKTIEKTSPKAKNTIVMGPFSVCKKRLAPHQILVIKDSSKTSFL